VGTLNSGRLENGRCVTGHPRDRIWSGGSAAAANAAIVEGYRSEVLSQARTRAMPHVRGVSQSHDEQDRLTLALFIPVDSDALIYRVRHGSSDFRQNSVAIARPKADAIPKYQKLNRTPS
jgi:hypothetical protein